MKNRQKKEKIKNIVNSKIGRITVLTGARQTGKTTLIKECFPDWPYILLEDPVIRPSYTRMAASEWIARYPMAIIDEVQKAPSIIETIKAAYDMNKDVRYILLGSSQILLLEKVKESLAGRVAIEELYPLLLPETITNTWEDPIQESRLLRWIADAEKNESLLLGIPLANSFYGKCKQLFEYYLHMGSMPTLYDPDLSEEEKFIWLKNYEQTYLQRDIRDLANLRDLEPFVLAQKALALRSGKMINFNDIARNAHIAPKTAKKFLRYLELSYQVINLTAYSRNQEKRLSKSCKIHFLDPGIQKTILNKKGDITGEEFESAVVAEIYKQLKSREVNVDFFHLRTIDGREVDLLLELEDGFIAIEIKSSENIVPSDARHLRGLDELLDKPLLYSLVISNDQEVKKLGPKIMAVPAAWLLAPMV